MVTQRRTPGSQTSLREANRDRIVSAVKKHGGLTQVELAGVTGLSAATVSNIVKELSAATVLHTSPTTQSGRRAQYVTLAHSLGLVVGVHFSTRHLRVALADVTQTVLVEHHFPLAKDHRADNELNKTMYLIADMLDSVGGTMSEVLAVCIGLPAPVNRAAGTTSRSGILRGWDGVPVVEAMRARVGRPVYLDNDATLAGMAEHRIGAARGRNNAVYLDVGDTIGAGLILNGLPFRGATGGAGEFGHTTLGSGGILCRCGQRGCLESVAGGAAILGSLRKTQGALKLQDVVLRAMAGDDACARAIALAGTQIGIAAGNLCNLLDPERLVIGGELAQAGELLLGPIRRVVESSVLSGVATEAGAGLEIVVGQLGSRAAMLGAVAHAVDQVAVSALPIVA